MRKLIYNNYQIFRNQFIGRYLSKNTRHIEQNKYKLAFNLYFMSFAISLIYLPILLILGYYVQLALCITILLVNALLILSFKYTDTLKSGAFIQISLHFIATITQIYFSQGTINFVTISWYVISSLFAYFIFGRKAGTIVMSIIIFVVAFFVLLKMSEYPFPISNIKPSYFYFGTLMSIGLAFLFIMMIVDRYTKYNTELINNIYEAQMRLSTIVENLPSAAAYIYNEHLFFNKKFQQLTGYSTNDIKDIDSLEKILFLSTSDFHKSKINQIRNKKNSDSNILQINTKNNSTKTIELFIQNDNNYEIWLFNDLTDLKQKEHQLSESNYLIENIAQALPNILYVFDFEKKQNVYSNHSLENILGYSVEEFRGKYKTIYDAIHPEDLTKVVDEYLRLLVAKDEDVFEIDYRIKHKNGNYIWLRSINKIFKRNSNGDVQLILGIGENINDKVEYQEQYKKITDRLLLAANSLKFGIWDWNLNTNEFYWDESMYQLFHTNVKSEKSPVEIFMERVHPDDYELAWIGIDDAYLNKDTFESIFRIIIPENEVRYIQVSYKVVKDNFDKPYRLIGINQDITDRKKQETEKTEITDRLILATSALNFGVWDWDIKSNNIIWDKNQYQLFETNQDSSKSIEDVFNTSLPPSEKEFVWQQINHSIAQHKDYYEMIFRIITNGHKEKYIQNVAKIFRDKNTNAYRIVGLNWDITKQYLEQKKIYKTYEIINAINIQANLIYAEDNFDTSVFNLLADVGRSIDVDEIFISCFNTKEYTFDIKHQWERKTLIYDKLIPFEKPNLFSNSDFKILKEKIKVGNVIKINNDNKDYISLLQSDKIKSIIISPIYVAGNFWGSMAIIDRKNEDGWKNYEESVIQNFANCIGVAVLQNQNKIALIKQKEKAEFASKTKSDFLATISHEVRTPLNAINGLSQFFIEAQNHNEEQKTELQLLKSASESLATLMDNILNFNKVDFESEVLYQDSFSISELLNKVYDTYKHAFYSKGIDFKIEIDRNIPTALQGDFAKINQIFNNLISNAMKFTNKGEVKIKAEFIGLQNKKNAIYFSVEDTGMGIDNNKLEEIFKPFSQINNKLGTGLGLSVSQRLANVMGSTIKVKSELNKTTIFYFTLLLDSSNKKITKKHVENETIYNLHNINILLVEDNEVNALIASKLLTSWGAKVHHVIDGNQAIETLSNNHFNIVLLDLFLPEIDGYETARLIRNMNDSLKSNIPIIAITASVLPDVKQQVIDFGMNNYIAKPYLPKELFSKVASALKLTIN